MNAAVVARSTSALADRVDERDAPRQAALSAHCLVREFKGRRVVDEVSLTLHHGEYTAIVGPNGAGKSTLLSMLAGVARADAGEVRLAHRPMHAWSSRERARRVAWLAQQSDAGGELAARDIVRLGRLPRHGLFGAYDARDEAEVEAAMAETECAAFASRRLNELSGGERQRVLLARALAVRASVLLLDEPTTHLDVPHQRALARSLVAQARRGVAVVAVLHDLTLALAADRVVVMRLGRVCADGPPADASVRAALVAAFDDAISIQPVTVDGHERFVAVARLS
ncbi:MAG TPA: ABC transporter ATP-binding protein [Burkholderiaceae bacterium]|nr:ABC transporter ATP-binding protein [Burkholderiaceae bacterium]